MFSLRVLRVVAFLFFIHQNIDYRISLAIRRRFFSFQNDPKNLDPSYKTDLWDLWDCLGRVKVVLQQHFIGLILLFVVSLDRGNLVL